MEPTLHNIEDYNGKELQQKRKIVIMVAIGFGYTLIKNDVDSNMSNSFIALIDKLAFKS